MGLAKDLLLHRYTTCPICGKKWEAISINDIYCSKECAAEGRRLKRKEYNARAYQKRKEKQGDQNDNRN